MREVGYNIIIRLSVERLISYNVKLMITYNMKCIAAIKRSCKDQFALSF